MVRCGRGTWRRWRRATPTFWNASSYELTYRIESVCQAEVGDDSGRFSFSVFFLDPHQGADVLILEGLATDGAGVPGDAGPGCPGGQLREHREAYLRAPEAQVTFEVETDGLGPWTAYGQRWSRELLVAPRGTRTCAPRRTTRRGQPTGTAASNMARLGDATWTLRLMELGGPGTLSWRC